MSHEATLADTRQSVLHSHTFDENTGLTGGLGRIT
jgi:hypothetical protein